MVIGLLMTLIATSVALLPSRALAMGAADHHPNIWIQVTDFDTGMPIKRNKTLNEVITFQVTVTNYGADCTGQFIVTALGDPAQGAPPTAAVQTWFFNIGPSMGSNSSSSEPLISSVLPDGFNDWKISASCNGAAPHQRSFDFFEFFVELPQ
jgi:hypothetical protein